MVRLYVTNGVMYDLVPHAGNYARPAVRPGDREQDKKTSASGAGGAQ